jgi:very-short-patch-repair endonuclease
MTDPLLIERCREFRKNPTLAEALLWEQLRNKRLAGIKFRRQHPIAGYVLDFFCFEIKLGVELDGAVHTHKDQAEYDACRTLELTEEGVTILRFWNSEVIGGIDSVLERIRLKAESMKSDKQET